MLNLLKSKKFQIGQPSREAGFTLIELLIAVSIIVILITIGAVSYTTVNRNARDAQRKTDLQKIATALEEYYSDNGQYPPPNPPSITSVSYEAQPWINGLDTYISTIPVDPINTSSPARYYEYVSFSGQQRYLLMTNLENNGDSTRRVYIGPGNIKSPCNEAPYYAEAGSYRQFNSTPADLTGYDWCISSPKD